MNKVNYTLMCDFYELTMANGYFELGFQDTVCYFDVFYRTVPDDGGFAISAGLEQVIEYITKLKFTTEDILFLKEKNLFSNAFLDYLKDFKFRGDIYAVPEGTVIFPNEPIMKVKAKAIEAQLIETYVLTTMNYQSLIATKANRIVRAAKGRPITEFGARRAHGAESATLGARAAYIGGVKATSNTLADRLYGIPSSGTMAHSWVQMFPTELEAFKSYCKIYPDYAVILVDTYNVLKSGVPNAIKAFDEILKPLGKRPIGIRLDSGDIAYQSKKAREMLDNAGYSDCIIFASNSLDERLIRDLIIQNARLDAFGVGERLITSKSSPVFDGVYKLVAVDNNGVTEAKIKISENIEKITTPGNKRLYRLYSRKTNKAEADLLTLADEFVDDTASYELFDPLATWKRKILTDFYKKELLLPIFQKGKLVYTLPTIEEIRQHCKDEIASMWDEVTRFDFPHNYYVDLSQKLWDLKFGLLEANRDKV